MSVKPRTNLPRDGHCTTILETDPILELMKITNIKWLCHGTIQCSMVTWINHRYIKLTTPLLLMNNPNSFLWISVKVSSITNLTHNLIFKTWSSPVWDKFCFDCAERWCVLIFTTSVQAFSFLSITAFQMHQQRLVCYYNQMHIEFTHYTIILNHILCCFKLYIRSVALPEVAFLWKQHIP